MSLKELSVKFKGSVQNSKNGELIPEEYFAQLERIFWKLVPEVLLDPTP